MIRDKKKYSFFFVKRRRFLWKKIFFLLPPNHVFQKRVEASTYLPVPGMFFLIFFYELFCFQKNIKKKYELEKSMSQEKTLFWKKIYITLMLISKKKIFCSLVSWFLYININFFIQKFNGYGEIKRNYKTFLLYFFINVFFFVKNFLYIFFLNWGDNEVFYFEPLIRYIALVSF